jgi:hypothetical protein
LFDLVLEFADFGGGLLRGCVGGRGVDAFGVAGGLGVIFYVCDWDGVMVAHLSINLSKLNCLAY